MKKFFRTTFVLMTLLTSLPVLAQETRADSYFAQGKSAFKAGQYQRAAEDFERARRAGMTGPAVSYNLGVAYYKLGRYQAAELAFRETARYRGMRDLAHYNLGLVSLKQGNRAQAESWWRQTFNETRDPKLKALAASRLESLSPRRESVRQTGSRAPERWLGLLSADIGHDDNVTLENNALAGASGKSDNFIELFGYLQGLLSGELRNGVLLKASVYRLEYNSQTAYNMTVLNAGLYKTLPLAHWRSETGVYFTDASLGGSDYLRSWNLSFDARRQLTAGPRLRLRARYHKFDAQSAVYDYLSGNSVDLRAQARWKWAGRRSLRAYYQLDLNNRNDLRVGNTFSSFSPTRHTLYLSYAQPLTVNWRFEGMLEYRTSRYADDYILAGGAHVQRTDDRTRFGAQFTRALARNTDLVLDYKHTRNSSTLNQYSYSRNVFTAGIQYLF